MRIAAVCSWVGLTGLSLAPGLERPYAGLAVSVMASMVAGFLTRMGWQRVESRRQIVLFALASAAAQVCRAGIGAGDDGLGAWVAGTTGAVIGVVLARSITHER